MLCSQVRPGPAFPSALPPPAPPGGWPGSGPLGASTCSPELASTFLVFSQGPAEIHSYLSNRNKVSPLQSQLLSGYVPVCDTIYTSPIPAAPSRQMASWPHWVFGSLLPFTPPVLGHFAGLGLAGTELGPIRGPSPPKGFPSLSHLENQELSQV